MAIGDVYLLAVNQTYLGAPGANVYAYQQINAAAPAEVPEIELASAWIENLRPLQAGLSSDQWQHSCITTRQVRPVGGIQYLNTSVAQGDIIGSGLASDTCCITRCYAPGATKRDRGRKFLYGVPQTSHKWGRLNSGGIAALRAFAGQLLVTLQKGGGVVQFALVLISTLDALIRTIVAADGYPSLTKLNNRRTPIC